MNLLRRFREHPASVDETYLEHAEYAATFGWAMLRGALGCLVHAAFPWLCTTTGSQTVMRLHERLVRNQARSRRIDPYRDDWASP